jgi:transcriptional regulator with XRE-family HTH domain
MTERIVLQDAPKATNYFREWRIWKGWTQQQLADEMQTTKATVSRIENGTRDWSKGYLEAFAHVIGCANIADPLLRPPEGKVENLNSVRSADYEQLRIHIREVARDMVRAAGKKIDYDPDAFAAAFIELVEDRLDAPEGAADSHENVVRFQLRKLAK